MNLKHAQDQLSRDARYRRHYEKHKDGVALAMHLAEIRKRLGINHPDLASELGISKYDISKVENLRGRVEPWVVSALVTRFEKELKAVGVDTEKWFAPKPEKQQISTQSAKELSLPRDRRPILDSLARDGSRLNDAGQPSPRSRSSDPEEIEEA